MAKFVVAIDGRAGSGKSTTAKAVAKRLNFLYLDTGAMYRAFTLKYLNAFNSKIISCAFIKKLLKNTKIDLITEDDKTRIFLDGQNVSREIRTPQVNNFVSQISAIPEVREWMVARQRAIAKGKKVVCEGRDITTVVFPDAQVKIFMDANLSVRAKRRQKELGEKSINVNLDEIVENLKFRDVYDSQRAHSPLKKAADAIVIDTTNLTIEHEISLVEKIVREKLQKDSGTNLV